ncbi:hypothetical protein HMPREF9442_01635 [Paraprevotella xylaniphila YIT 11841]|uniref:Uncharacterized protein n=1 Tax=Paraprevotella xylaniphila YIT 11841 TaxID=762982 RepID=F3QTW6_9BACT|nr:hypothetical protein HMPREF9442_01635 [Paraprevotella xylaniphila YIT 11841]
MNLKEKPNNYKLFFAKIIKHKKTKDSMSPNKDNESFIPSINCHS